MKVSEALPVQFSLYDLQSVVEAVSFAMNYDEFVENFYDSNEASAPVTKDIYNQIEV
jgi:hypothetical protein